MLARRRRHRRNTTLETETFSIGVPNPDAETFAGASAKSAQLRCRRLVATLSQSRCAGATSWGDRIERGRPRTEVDDGVRDIRGSANSSYSAFRVQPNATQTVPHYGSG